MTGPESGAPLTGTVASFDDNGGWGVVTAEDGTEYPFHCTAVADGSRTIPARAEVIFWLRPGHRGQWEAAGLTPRQYPP
ncbi:cold-shock protein [Candidatus Poriferisocius sp.]|uniref:cold-shock protein n=1 Tax=Candidatus Poriferisocius sp. TaxID=3101276 RepID=UPI003B58F0A0